MAETEQAAAAISTHSATSSAQSVAKVYMGVPCYDGNVCAEGAVGVTQASRTTRPFVRYLGMSLLTRCFNTLWVEALELRKERGITHFLMLHSDIGPIEPFWLDKMLAIMDRVGADALSAVVPIKSHEGVTSTALETDIGEFPGWRVRRYTMQEVCARPAGEKTWTDPKLLLNTGLLLVDFQKPWVENIWFHFEDRIVKGADGRFKVLNFPEDWQWSKEAKALGAKLYATAEIPVVHFGRQGYANLEPWGSLAVDKGFETGTEGKT